MSTSRRVLVGTLAGLAVLICFAAAAFVGAADPWLSFEQRVWRANYFEFDDLSELHCERTIGWTCYLGSCVAVEPNVHLWCDERGTVF